MTVPDGDGSGAGDDALELGGGRKRVPRWCPPSAALVPGVVALVAGLAVGYAVGARHPGEHAAPPVPSRAAAPAAPFSAGGFPLSQSGPPCSAPAGRGVAGGGGARVGGGPGARGPAAGGCGAPRGGGRAAAGRAKADRGSGGPLGAAGG